MQNDTRIKFNAYSARIALLNGVASAAVAFTVTPAIQQTLENKIQESAEFLKRINVVPVRDMQGDKLGLGVTGPIASRTDTSGAGKRSTRYPGTLESRRYQLYQTNFDTHIRYATLDAWSQFPDFEVRVRNQIIQQQALDRIMIGWHGTSAAATTDPVANPKLQDVNKGWLQHAREQAPERVLRRIRTGGTDLAPVYRNEVRVGPGGDYENMDALVFDAVQLLDPWHREDTGLQAYVGRELMHDKYFPIVNVSEKASEVLAGQTLLAQKRIGKLPASVEAYFPANSIAITRDDNLSIYYQASSRRRHLKDHPEKDQIENYESSNEGYVIERLGQFALIENIVLGDWSEPE